jgi:hypothetical protein
VLARKQAVDGCFGDVWLKEEESAIERKKTAAESFLKRQCDK